MPPITEEDSGANGSNCKVLVPSTGSPTNGLIEVASEPSVAKKYIMCIPRCNVWGVAVAVNVVEVLPVLLARVQVPLAVSIWKYMFCGGGAVGEYVDVAVKENIGVALVVVLPASGVMTVFSGIAVVGAGVITVTFALLKLAT